MKALKCRFRKFKNSPVPHDIHLIISSQLRYPSYTWFMSRHLYIMSFSCKLVSQMPWWQSIFLTDHWSLYNCLVKSLLNFPSLLIIFLITMTQTGKPLPHTIFHNTCILYIPLLFKIDATTLPYQVETQ